MAKKKTEKKESKKLSLKEELDLLAQGYFDRYPKVSEFFATEEKQFFFKESDCTRNANGGKIFKFKRGK